MSTQERPQYLLLFRGFDWHKSLSPEEIQQVITDMYAWFDRLKQEGKLLAGHPLETEGKVVSDKKGSTVVDGPYAESKEAVAGYFLLQVDTFEEAVEISKNYPALNYGGVVEVRPVAPACTMEQILGEREKTEKAGV